MAEDQAEATKNQYKEENSEEVENRLHFDFEDFVKNELKLSEDEIIYCPLYQKGQCRDRNCPYKHIKLSTAVVCKHWLRGLCKKNEKCDFLHEYNLKKMPECFFFNDYGVCNNMTACSSM